MSSPPLTSLAAAVLRVGPAPERVLQIGCRNGEGALFLAREFPSARVRGIDGSEARIHEAKARVGLDPEGRIAFKAGQARAIPYPDGFFDLVAAVDTRPSPVEVVRVLRSGGHLILASSNQPGLVSRARTRSLHRRLARHGLEPVESGEAGDGDFWVACLRGKDLTGISI